MGRPKGSKNKVKKAVIKGPASMDEQIGATKAQMESLFGEIDGLTAEIREKRKQLNVCKKEYAALLAQKEQMRQAEEESLRQEQARRIADAFLASGKSVEEILPLLELPAGVN